MYFDQIDRNLHRAFVVACFLGCAHLGALNAKAHAQQPKRAKVHHDAPRIRNYAPVSGMLPERKVSP